MLQLLMLQLLMKTAGVEVRLVAVGGWWTGDEKECSQQWRLVVVSKSRIPAELEVVLVVTPMPPSLLSMVM